MKKIISLISILAITALVSCRQQDEDLIVEMQNVETLNHNNRKFSDTIKAQNTTNGSTVNLEGGDPPPKNGGQWKQSK